MLNASLKRLSEKYDFFLIDQFGVLLDGKTTYPGSAYALQELKRLGKTVIILSNSGKRSWKNAERLERHGIPKGNYSHFVTSGEVAHIYLSRKYRLKAGRRSAFVIASDSDRSAIQDLNLYETEDVQSCDLILISGSPGEPVPLETYRELFLPAVDRGVPAACTNPDITMLTENGTSYGAGSIAKVYADLGGTVEYYGKPHPAIYSVAHSLMGHPKRDRVICLGDSPAHDVVGGRNFGFRTALVRTGIHANESLEELTLLKSHRPDYVLERFAFEGDAI